jgi:hypothetical protein
MATAREEYRQWLTTAYQKNWKPSYANMLFIQKYHSRAPLEFGRHALFGSSPSTQTMKLYLDWLCDKYQDREHVNRYFRIEFGFPMETVGLALPESHGRAPYMFSADDL